MKSEILGYCAYCKDEIYKGEEVSISGSEIYHPDCLQQKNTFIDAFGDNIPEEE